jgi:transposase
MNIKRIGIDLAKQVFQVHGVDHQEKVVLRKQLRRSQMLAFFAKLAPCLIGMEACSSAHYWARELQKLGHIVKLMAPQFVKPYVKGNKNDANDTHRAQVLRRFVKPLLVQICVLSPLKPLSNKIFKPCIGYAVN